MTKNPSQKKQDPNLITSISVLLTPYIKKQTREDIWNIFRKYIGGIYKEYIKNIYKYLCHKVIRDTDPIMGRPPKAAPVF